MSATTQSSNQRGQTMALVALSMVSLLAMAALAIDVVTLYVARGQAERGADAAALAAAKVLADSGVTTDPTNASPDNIWKNACTLATQEANVVAGQNLIAGQSPTATVTFPNAPSTDCSGTPSSTSTFGTNPQVTVSLTATGLPTFFARIWSKATNSVSASASAEAYNPSNSSVVNLLNGAVPNAPRCVKPLLLPNCDPRQSSHGGSGCTGGTFDSFFSPAAGTIINPGDKMASGVIGESFALVPTCPTCTPTVNGSSNPPTLTYYPVTLPNGAGYVCPGNCPQAYPSADDFENDLACCNLSKLQCGQIGPVPYSSASIATEAKDAGQCLIHGSGQSFVSNCQSNLDQDCLDTTSSPPLFSMKAGTNNPLVGKATGAGVAVGDLITTSDSMVSLAIYDSSSGNSPTSSPTIIGYLQVFIDDVDSSGNVTVTVLNVAGCGTSTSPGASGISGAGPTLPVNLIHN